FLPNAMEEVGCAVCGQLTPVLQLTRLRAVKNQLHILEASGMTRVEWKDATRAIHEFKGPVIDYKCNWICDCCRKHLWKGQVPWNALAKGLWLGTVPEELASLRFVERMLVACVRINSSFVWVAASSLRKMTSHVITFESPVPKIY
ncbi:hypothetical protein L208DRAFT_1038676, partial [Tricholoma matsutake]